MLRVQHKSNGETVTVNLTQEDAQHLWNACLNYRHGLKDRHWAYNLADVYNWVMEREKRNRTDIIEYSTHGQGD